MKVGIGSALAAMAVAFVGWSAPASAASVRQFELFDHPDGNENPPPYGLRFDDILAGSGGDGGVTTFSFDTFADTILTVTDDMMGSITINISGNLFGGEKDSGFGVGQWALDFNYTMNVAPDGTGWIVTDNDSDNNGTLTKVGDEGGVDDGTSFEFRDKSEMGGDTSFRFLQDGHRLDDFPDMADMDPWVGRGWFKSLWYYDGDDDDDDDSRGWKKTKGAHDFLFLGKEIDGDPGDPIPLPSAAGLGLVGLGVVVSRRRR